VQLGVVFLSWCVLFPVKANIRLEDHQGLFSTSDGQGCVRTWHSMALWGRENKHKESIMLPRKQMLCKVPTNYGSLLAIQTEPFVTFYEEKIVLNPSRMTVARRFCIHYSGIFFLFASLLIQDINNNNFYFLNQLLTQPWFLFSITRPELWSCSQA
jgi:hypothetical protein